MSAPLLSLSSRAKSRAYLRFLREAKARDGVEGSLATPLPLVAQALLPVLLRPRLSLYRHLQSARTVSSEEFPTR
jgi:hypothetical protein